MPTASMLTHLAMPTGISAPPIWSCQRLQCSPTWPCQRLQCSPTWSRQREYLLRQFVHANGFNAHPLGHANGNICSANLVMPTEIRAYPGSPTPSLAGYPCVSGFVAHRGYDLTVHLHGHRIGGHAAVVSPCRCCRSRVAGAGVPRPRRRRVGSIVPPPTLRQRASA